jgi:hypothetical protein
VTTHNLSNFDNMLKDWYVDDRVKELSFFQNAFYSMLEKKNGQEAGARQYIQPIEYEHPGGESADFTEAMTNNHAGLWEQFVLARKAQYKRVLVDYELLAATKTNRDAFEKAMKIFDKGFKGFGAKIGRRLFRTLGGSIGQLSIASTSTTSLSFADRAHIFGLQIGTKLQFSATDGTGSLLASGAYVTVTAVNHRTNVFTIDQTLNVAISGVATTSYVFQKGDYGACLNGLEDWLPVDDRDTRLAAAFNGVTRSASPVLLGGVYLDGTSMALDEVMINLVGEIGLYGGMTDFIMANPRTLTDMQLLDSGKLQAQAVQCQLRSANDEVLVGFSGYRVVIGDKTVFVTGERHCPMGRVYALQLDTWTLWHAGQMVNWLGEDVRGTKLKDAENEASAEARLGSWCNLGCSAPGWNGVAKITPSAN